MVAAIACVDSNFGIGYNNKLLFNIKDDLEYFKSLTTDGIVIMGRKTWDSLPKKPLPNRVNIVITNNPLNHDGATYITLDAIKDYLNVHAPKTSNNIFIIGGESIYKELLPYCERVYLTKVCERAEDVDTYFPNIDTDTKWTLDSYTPIKEENGILYSFNIYNRKEF